MATAAITAAVLTLAAPGAQAGGAPSVLRVGSYHGIRGQFRSIQAAVDAAKPGDWILIGPGVYKEHGSNDPEYPAGVLVRTPWLHIRGMNRNKVVVDGTKASAPTCSSAKKDQVLGPKENGHPVGRNGIDVFEVSGVTVDNLTVCNYLTTPTGDAGNEIWWNGGDG